MQLCTIHKPTCVPMGVRMSNLYARTVVRPPDELSVTPQVRFPDADSGRGDFLSGDPETQFQHLQPFEHS